MIEKITVSRDEVLHYSWIDHTWVYLHYTKTPLTTDPLFSRGVKALLKLGIQKTTGQDFDGIITEDGYVFIQYGTDEIIDILKNAATWLVTNHITVKDPQHPLGKFYLENTPAFQAFFDETRSILEAKTYRYFFQCVDGMN